MTINSEAMQRINKSFIEVGKAAEKAASALRYALCKAVLESKGNAAQSPYEKTAGGQTTMKLLPDCAKGETIADVTDNNVGNMLINGCESKEPAEALNRLGSNTGK